MMHKKFSVADRWERCVRTWKSDCENILESDAQLKWDRHGKVLMLARLCFRAEDRRRKRGRDLLMCEDVF